MRMPPELIALFRSAAVHRLETIEAAWSELVQGSGGRARATALSRELHTLKGEARTVGFSDVHSVAHKLEALIAVADGLGYRVSEDLDLMIVSAIQFLAMLVRRPPDRSLQGIDVAGFVSELEALIQDDTGRRAEAPSSSVRGLAASSSVAAPPEWLSLGTRRRLAEIATNVFLEHLAAGRSRARLRAVWHDLIREFRRLELVDVSATLNRQAHAAAELARVLAKEVDLELDAPDTRVAPEIAECLGVALLHGIRNALGHGIESPQLRRAAGKSSIGRIRVTVRTDNGSASMRISDDGAGVNFGSVRRRAVALRLLSDDESAGASEQALLRLLFLPAFSTLERADELAGRGMGLDAVAAAVEALSGSVSIESQPGYGTQLEIRIPMVAQRMAVHVFPIGSREAINAAVPASWVAHDGVPNGAEVFDLASFLGIAGSVSRTNGRTLALLRDGRSVYVAAAGVARAATADRICPTSDDHPIEVVVVDGAEVVLWRPERGAPARAE